MRQCSSYLKKINKSKKIVNVNKSKAFLNDTLLVHIKIVYFYNDKCWLLVVFFLLGDSKYNKITSSGTPLVSGNINEQNNIPNIQIKVNMVQTF